MVEAAGGTPVRPDEAAAEAPVTIIGAGPAGLVTSLLLSKYQVRHVLVEKYPTMAHTPRAHIINQRTVEILRDLGLEDAFRRTAMPWDMMRNTVWHTSLSGLELARRQAWGTAPERHADYVRASPCEPGNCGQHLLEPLLLEAASRSIWADFLLGHECLSVEQDSCGVTATVRERATSQVRKVRSSYLVGADGARGVTVSAAGLEFLGEEGISASATIHFHADLSRFTARRPGTLYWNATAGSGDFRGYGNLICHQPWHDWALVFSYDPQVLDATDRGHAMERLRRVIGDDSVDIEIKNVSTWTINRLVARMYSAGRLFCVGDAVHRHPPTNGLGLNTSVADAYNLAWKLAHVVRGAADPALLETYSQERQPVGQQVVDRAYASIGDMRPITAALGFQSGQSEAEGTAALRGLYAPGPDGEARRTALAKAVEHTDYQFNAHGVEVGYRYRSGAIAGDGTAEPTPTRDPELYYEPTTWPGAHLPHAWLDDGGRRLSTYDIAGDGRFVLITGIGGEPWRDEAEHVAAQLGVRIDVAFIGTQDGYTDCYGDWRRQAEVGESGCVLVRPDLFVGWRAASADPGHTGKLRTVMEMLLARNLHAL
jgi:2,4-dichlorophenol 6-monooxygenase